METNNNGVDKEQIIRDLSQGAGLLAKGTAALGGEAVVAAGRGISFLSAWFKTTIERGQEAQREQLLSRERIAHLEALLAEQKAKKGENK